MQALRNDRRYNKQVGCSLLACAIVALGAPTGAHFSNETVPVEITKIDLLGTKDWQRMPIAIHGFALGMTKEEVVRVARTSDLKLITRAPRTVGETHGPCRTEESSCAVYRAKGPWIGVDLSFDSSNRLAKMSVSVPMDAIPDVKRANVAQQFKGLTYKFFDEYSDALREQIFGSAERRETAQSPGSPLVNVDYSYPRLGVAIHVTVDKNDNPPKPFDLTLDFVTPQ